MDAWALGQAGNLETGFLALSQIRAPGSAQSPARASRYRALTPVTPQCYYHPPATPPPKSVWNGLGQYWLAPGLRFRLTWVSVTSQLCDLGALASLNLNFLACEMGRVEQLPE